MATAAKLPVSGHRFFHARRVMMVVLDRMPVVGEL